jgi:hypothetical protein
VALIDGKVWLTVNSWLTKTNPSRYTVSVNVSEVTGLLAKAMGESCEAASKSSAPKIALALFLHQAIFSANAHVLVSLN